MPGRNLTPWQATREVIEREAQRNGRTLEQIMPAVIKKLPLFWIVDRTREAWTGVPAAATQAFTALPREPSARWRLLHVRSYAPVADHAAELAFINGLASGMNGPCNCASHWATYISAHPPTIDTPAEYQAWAIAAHNVVNLRLKYPLVTMEQARQIHAPPIVRSPYPFAYFSGSNRQGEGDRIAAMIRSARRAGVAEDFHAFAVEDVAGAINHRIPASRHWKNHMAKVDLLAEMAAITGDQYEAYVWLDSDNWFVRDPGDIRKLLRDNPIWVGMESDLRQSVQGDWYGMPSKGSPSLIDLMIEAGCRPDFIHGVNGGFWIVRREAVTDFHQRAFKASEFFGRNGYPAATNDEPALAVLGSTMVHDPEANSIGKWSHVWACDWAGRWTDRLPDGRPWVYKDWGTQQEAGEINPAIVHNMRGKNLMTHAG